MSSGNNYNDKTRKLSNDLQKASILGAKRRKSFIRADRDVGHVGERGRMTVVAKRSSNYGSRKVTSMALAREAQNMLESCVMTEPDEDYIEGRGAQQQSQATQNLIKHTVM